MPQTLDQVINKGKASAEDVLDRDSAVQFVSAEDVLDRELSVQFVSERYNEGRKASMLDFERFGRYYGLFRNKQTTKNYVGLANLFIPEPYRIVRKKTAKLFNAIRKIKVSPETQNDLEGARMATSLLNFLRRKLNWRMTERAAIQESRITGLSWLKVVWNLDNEEVDKPYRGYDVSMVSADSLLLAPETTILDVFEGNVKWLIHTYEADYETLKKNPNYTKESLALLKERGGSYQEETALAQQRLTNQNRNKSRATKTYRICEFWGKYKGKDRVIVTADSAVNLRYDDNPYKEILDIPLPFVPLVANPIGKEMYPVGDIEPAESLFNELNDTRNQRMDTVTLNIDPAKEVLRGAQVDSKELVARRGWVIHSNIPGGVRFIPPDMQGVNAAINEEQAIRGDIQQVTGIVDFTPGSDVQAGVSIDTARGAIIAKNESDVITTDELELLRISLRMFYRIVLAFAHTFLDRAFTIRVMEKGVEQFHTITNDSVRGNFDLDVEMETLQDETTNQQLKLLMFNQAKTVPGAKLGKFFTDVLEAFYDDVNISEYYEEPQPTPPPPSVSISLKGDLNPLEVDEIYKSMGLDPAAADPLLRQELRAAMRGELPETTENEDKQLEVLQKQSDLMRSMRGDLADRELSDL